MNAETILRKGYLPKELPPPFNTDLFASHVISNNASLPIGIFPSNGSHNITKPIIHNLARAGTLRRRLAIPNPLSFHELALIVEREWNPLELAVNQSKVSLSTPTPDPASDRALPPKHDFGFLPVVRAMVRAGKRYIVKTDINTFYPSVYTHSIPWALHTKAIAKVNRSTSLLGNLLDLVVRNAQDGQTVGIPIGPDTSLLIAEILLTDVDNRLSILSSGNSFRYVDDYEIAYQSFSDAESGLASIQEVLSDYELQLNPRKTSILELPLPLDATWAAELRLYQIRTSKKGQATDIHSYFSKAFSLMPAYPDESILKYAIARFRSVEIEPDNWPLFENILLQCATIEPGILDSAITELAFFADNGFPINLDKLSSTLNGIIAFHAPLAHSSEVAWAIWGCIIFSLKIEKAATDKVVAMEDSVVALLALHANQLGLLDGSAQFTIWQTHMDDAGLVGSQWLLAYEAFIKGWLPSTSGLNYVTSHPYFSWLNANGVSFYDINRRPIRASQYVSYSGEDGSTLSYPYSIYP